MKLHSAKLQSTKSKNPINQRSRFMKKYDSYKDSGIEWIGEIPSHWEVGRFKYAYKFVNEKSELDLPKIGLEHIESWTGRLIQNDTEFDGDGPCFRKNDILFGKLRPYLAKVYLASFTGKAIGDFFVFRPEPHILPKYGHRLMLSQNFIEITNSSTFGSKMPRVSPDFISDLDTIIPPFTEQTAIAAYLDHKTTEIDELIAGKKRLLELYEEEKTALINQAVTKGLNPDAPMKDSGIEWLGEIPEHWEVKRLKYVLEEVIGGGTPSTNNPLYWNGEIPWISAKDVKQDVIVSSQDFITDKAVSESSTNFFEDNRIVIVVRSGILKHTFPVAINKIPISINQDLKALKPKPFLQIEFLFWKLKGHSKDILTYCKKMGATVDSIEMAYLLDFPFTFSPEIEEQKSIIRYIETETARIDDKIANTEKLIDLLTEYRTALISEVVTGKIKVVD